MRSWEKRLIHPTELLRRAVDFGLEDDSEDPGQAAGDEHMTLCTTRGIDIDDLNLLRVADHGSALADLLVWLTRNDGPPWQHPEDIAVGDETWESSAYLSATGSTLRQIWVTPRWGEQSIVAAEHSWAVRGEIAAYGVPMDLIVCIIGQRRESRWVGPLTAGWQHPVNGDLRIQKRSGEGFDGNWKRVFREEFRGAREDWLQALVGDGALADCVLTHHVPVPKPLIVSEMRAVAEGKLRRIRETREIPEPQLSRCFDVLHPCQFRMACPNFALPSEDNGFVRLRP